MQELAARSADTSPSLPAPGQSRLVEAAVTTVDSRSAVKNRSTPAGSYKSSSTTTGDPQLPRGLRPRRRVGIRWNHASRRRAATFVTREVTRAVARVQAGLQDKLYMGNLGAVRDWGYAPQCVEGM